MKNFTVKDRMLNYGDLAHISKTKLAKMIEISPSNFMPSNGCSSISSESVVRFLTAFPEVSSEWLMRGEGPMLRRSTAGVINGDVNNHAENNSSASITLNMERQNAELLRTKDEIIQTQRELINSLHSQIRMLEQSCSGDTLQIKYASEPQPLTYQKTGTKTEQNK